MLPRPPAPLWPLALALWLGLILGPQLTPTRASSLGASVFCLSGAFLVPPTLSGPLAGVGLALLGMARATGPARGLPPVEEGLWAFEWDQTALATGSERVILRAVYREGPRARLDTPLWTGRVEARWTPPSGPWVCPRPGGSPLTLARGRIRATPGRAVALQFVHWGPLACLGSLGVPLSGASVRPRVASVARWSGLIGARRRLAKSASWARAQRARGLVEALVLGRRDGLDPELREAFARSGLAHLLAISGLHVATVAGIVAAVVGWVLRWLGSLSEARWLEAGRTGPAARVVALVAAGSYVLLAGAPTSARRAAIMVAVALLATSLRRRLSGWTALGAALFGVLLLDPEAATSLGLALSVVSVAGLLALRRSRVAGERGGKPHPWGRLYRFATSLLGVFLASLATLLATAPFSAWAFGRVPVAALWTNVLVLPVFALLLPCILGVVLFGAVVPSWAGVGVGLISLVLEEAIGVVEWLAAPERCPVWTVSLGTDQLGVGCAALGLPLALWLSRR